MGREVFNYEKSEIDNGWISGIVSRDSKIERSHG